MCVPVCVYVLLTVGASDQMLMFKCRVCVRESVCDLDFFVCACLCVCVCVCVCL